MIVHYQAQGGTITSFHITVKYTVSLLHLMSLSSSMFGILVGNVCLPELMIKFVIKIVADHFSTQKSESSC